MVKAVEEYTMQGRYLSDGQWQKFESTIQIRPDRIIKGFGQDTDSLSREFDLHGISLEWNNHLVLIFLKHYQVSDNNRDNNGHRDFYYQICRPYTINNNDKIDFSGIWTGNWSSTVVGEARLLIEAAINRILLFNDDSCLDNIMSNLRSARSTRPKSPIVTMRDNMIAKTRQHNPDILTSVEVTLRSQEVQ